ncbi:MAG: hypothetical protein AAFU79_03330 [Myxococcota bacterium]
MSAPSGEAPDPEKVLTLVLPDWQRLDTVLGSDLPFPLWSVGAQPLLHHWLDHAVDAGYGSVRLRVSDRPAEVRRAMEDAKLWPIQWQVVPEPATVPPGPDDADVEYLDHLPGQAPLESPPDDGWALLRHWYALRKTWFDSVDNDKMEAFRTLAIGRFCSIHPTAELRMPVWIGDYAQIGPGCVVGPAVSVGRGAVLEGPSHLENSVITDHTYLAGHTELVDAYLDGGRLLNIRLSAEVKGLDAIVADRLRNHDDTRPTVAERAVAAALYVGFTAADRVLPGRPATSETWETFGGLPMSEGRGPLWRRRRTWLRHVVAGQMRMVGVLPRTREQLERLSPDWQEILRAAPQGVLSYSDLHGSHTAEDELEAIHAVYQASTPDGQLRATVRENASRILRTEV